MCSPTFLGLLLFCRDLHLKSLQKADDSLLLLQVLTQWQGCVGICHAFPKSPDVLALVEAVAKEAGEPPADALSASVQGSSLTGIACFYMCTS